MSSVKKTVSNAISDYDIATDFSDFNEYRIAKPSAYLNYFSQVSGLDLIKNYHTDELKNFNLSWVLLSTSFEVLKPMNKAIKLYAKTWQSCRRGSIFRRDVIFEDENNEVIFHGFNYTAAFDMKSRSIFRGEELPFRQPELYEKFTIKNRAINESSDGFINVDERKVYGSCIDGLGHVNNCRYGEFAYDALTSEEQKKEIRRMDICFKSELRKGDELSILKACDGDNVYIRGCNNTKSDISFNVTLSLE